MKTEKPIKKKSTTATAKAIAPVAPATAIKPMETLSDRMNTMTVAAIEAPVAKAVTTPIPVKHEITTELIAARAYTIWEEQGRPHGRDVANWLLAESQLMQEQSFTA